MTEQPINPTPKSFWTRLADRIPRLHSRWWTGLLALSLIGNLLIVGLIAGSRFGGHHRVERMAIGNLGQFVPRDFIMNLPRERRRELTGEVRKQMRAMREQNQNVTLSTAIADALEKDTLDTTALKASIDAFTTGVESPAGRSGKFALDVLAKLTPEERKQLAASIRNRAANQGSRKRKTEEVPLP